MEDDRTLLLRRLEWDDEDMAWVKGDVILSKNFPAFVNCNRTVWESIGGGEEPMEWDGECETVRCV